MSLSPWFFDGRYAIAVNPSGKPTMIYMHRIILLLAGHKPPFHTDHRDHKKLNNRLSNLRAVTHQQNHFNERRRKGGTSRYKGVSLPTGRCKWRAQIKVNGRGIFLGNFSSERQAALAYNDAACQYFGECAYLNTIT